METINREVEVRHESSASTVFIAVIIVLIIGAAFYFGFVRGHWGGNNSGGSVNVELNTPDTGGAGGSGGTQY